MREQTCTSSTWKQFDVTNTFFSGLVPFSLLPFMVVDELGVKSELGQRHSQHSQRTNFQPCQTL